jgi:hypothetical protein
MARITYTNKSRINVQGDIPDNQKVNADDMNQIKDVVNVNYEEMKDELYYKNNDVIELGSSSASSSIVMPGFITTGSTSIYTTIYTSKKLSNVISMTVNEMQVEMRSIDGYIEGSGFHNLITMANVSLTATRSSDHSITLVATKSTGWKNSSNSNTSNNTPVVLNGYIKITF